MQDNKTVLNVSTDVLEKMAELAATEIKGVSSLSKCEIDIKETFRMKSAFKSVKIENVNGAVLITVNVCIKEGANAREVAEGVQKNVKDKIQTMAGTVVTRVNVNIVDIDTEETKDE